MNKAQEDDLLLQLKNGKNPWKEIKRQFNIQTGKQSTEASLQMRYKRLREKMPVWTDDDICALKMAHNYWLSQKFEIIAGQVSFDSTLLSTFAYLFLRCPTMAPQRAGPPNNAPTNGMRSAVLETTTLYNNHLPLAPQRAGPPNNALTNGMRSAVLETTTLYNNHLPLPPVPMIENLHCTLEDVSVSVLQWCIALGLALNTIAWI